MKLFLRIISLLIIFTSAAFADDGPAVNYDETKVPEYTLPDVLQMQDGRNVTDKEMWMNERRPEILELFRENVFGHSPDRPEHMTFETVLEDDSLYNGMATRRSVRVCFTEREDGPCMLMHVFIPNDAPKPVPVFVGVLIIKNFEETQDWPMPGYLLSEQVGGLWKYVDTGVADEQAAKPIGKLPGKKLPQVILKSGYAFASIDPDSIAPDDPELFDSQVISEFSGRNTAARPRNDWQTIGAWAWGISRAVDYFETDPDIDATKVISIGHSRRGKTSLWAGAQDQRIAIVISNNSGCTGAAISRRRFGETVYFINMKFPHWFCLNYRNFDHKEDELPIDQHMLLGLIAPRPLYVASASEDHWSDPLGEFLGALNAGPVYELFGEVGLGVDKMPAINDPVGETIGYHKRSGKHAMTDYDWLRYLKFADRHLKK